MSGLDEFVPCVPFRGCAVPFSEGATGEAPTGEAGARSRRDRKVTNSATVEKATMMK